MVRYLKNLWNALWAKTTIDEEFKSRYDEVVKELADVKKAAKNVARQTKDVVEAAKASEVDSFISSLPDGYHTMMGERGLKLSG